MEKAKTDKRSSEFYSYQPLTGCAVLAFSASLSPCCGWSLSFSATPKVPVSIIPQKERALLALLPGRD